jgi:hypothetical protein
VCFLIICFPDATVCPTAYESEIKSVERGKKRVARTFFQQLEGGHIPAPGKMDVASWIREYFPRFPYCRYAKLRFCQSYLYFFMFVPLLFDVKKLTLLAFHSNSREMLANCHVLNSSRNEVRIFFTLPSHPPLFCDTLFF